MKGNNLSGICYFFLSIRMSDFVSQCSHVGWRSKLTIEIRSVIHQHSLNEFSLNLRSMKYYLLCLANELVDRFCGRTLDRIKGFQAKAAFF